jgi:hypothetical protein
VTVNIKSGDRVLTSQTLDKPLAGAWTTVDLRLRNIQGERLEEGQPLTLEIVNNTDNTQIDFDNVKVNRSPDMRSFESTFLLDGAWTNDFGNTGWALTDVGTGGGGGLFNPNATHLADEALSGSNVGWINGKSTASVAVDTAFSSTVVTTLSIAVAGRSDYPAGQFMMRARAGGEIIAAQLFSPPVAGKWSAADLVVDGRLIDPRNIEGKQITLEIINLQDGTQLDFDNLLVSTRDVTAPLPQPAPAVFAPTQAQLTALLGLPVAEAVQLLGALGATKIRSGDGPVTADFVVGRVTYQTDDQGRVIRIAVEGGVSTGPVINPQDRALVNAP